MVQDFFHEQYVVVSGSCNCSSSWRKWTQLDDPAAKIRPWRNWWRSYMAKQTADGGWINKIYMFLSIIYTYYSYHYYKFYFFVLLSHPYLHPLKGVSHRMFWFCDQAKRVLVMANFNVTLAGNQCTKKTSAHRDPFKKRWWTTGHEPWNTYWLMTVQYKLVFPQMVVPPKHPKTIIFSRKTNGCWVPAF